MNESFSIFGQTVSNYIMCYIDGENIVQQDGMGNRQIIGKTNYAYNELQGTTQQYYDKLVELGVITPPKKPEEMMADMQNNIKDMASVIAALSQQVKELKEHGNGHERCTCSCGENVPVGKSKRSSSKGTASDSGDSGQS